MHTLGIDLGGTYARAAVVDAGGRIVASAKTALTNRGPEAVVEAIHQAAEGAITSAGNPAIRGCGVGVAGQLGPNGRVIVGPNLGWRDVPFGQLLAGRLGRPVRVVNDLAAASWGEFNAGAGRGAQDILVVFVGSGVGSSLISNGRFVRGAAGVAGEFGHIKVVPGGRLCGCGERGCLEAYAGGHNLIAQMRDAIQGTSPTLLSTLSGNDPRKLTPVLLEEAALKGDAAAKAIYEAVAGHLSLAIANQVTVLNPARLILGGGVLSRTPGLLQRIRDGVAAWTNANARAAVSVVTAELGDDSGLIGAGLLATAD
ncbi:MAG TPA: ROK family protein [Myxococcaceae bacterium]|nr:ROK family protein [Myxococcaceae bacterium]